MKKKQKNRLNEPEEAGESKEKKDRLKTQNPNFLCSPMELKKRADAYQPVSACLANSDA